MNTLVTEVAPETNISGMGAAFTTAPLLTLAVGMWLLEQRKRSDVVVVPSASSLACLGVVRTYFKEIMMIMAGAGLVTFLVVRGEHLGAPIPADDQAWNELKHEWPILMTGDSLLALQSILRLILLVSVILKSHGSSSDPLGYEAAALMLSAAVVRVAILMLSPPLVYTLDGPLGGKMNLAFELAAVPLLLVLSKDILRTGRCGALLLTAATLLSAWAAHGNQLSLADEQDAHLDFLFTFEHLLETCAAIAVLTRTAASWAGSSASHAPMATLAHVILPLQQLLAAYFLLVGFSQPWEFPPELTRVGHPLLILRVAGVTQVGLYLLAATLHFTEGAEESKAALLSVEV